MKRAMALVVALGIATGIELPIAYAADTVQLTVRIDNQTGLKGGFNIGVGSTGSRSSRSTNGEPVVLTVVSGADTSLGGSFRFPADGWTGPYPGKQASLELSFTRTAPLKITTDTTVTLTIPPLTLITGSVVDSAGKPVGSDTSSRSVTARLAHGSLLCGAMTTDFVTDSLGVAYRSSLPSSEFDIRVDGAFSLLIIPGTFRRTVTADATCNNMDPDWRESPYLAISARLVDGQSISFRSRGLDLSSDRELLVCLITDGPAFASPNCVQDLESWVKEWDSVQAAKRTAERDARLKAGADRLAAQKAAASTKKTTITCSRGKAVRKVAAVKPKCPTGWKRR